MYAEAKKDIYGTIEVLLIFGIKLLKILDKMGHQRNEYNWCVMNNIVKVKQFTILCSVYDLKNLHVDPDITYNFLADIDAEYGNIAKITITRSKIHKYLYADR